MKPALFRGALLIVLMTIVLRASADDHNVVANPGFENGTNNWAYLVVGAKSTGEVDKSVHHRGTASFRMTHESKFQANVFSRIEQGLGGLKPDTAYRISCWVKGRDVGIAWIGGGPGWATRVNFPKGDFDWQQVSGDYLTGPAETGFDMMILCETPTKSVWIDDVEFVEDPAKTVELKQKRQAAEAARQEKLKNYPGDLKKRADDLRGKIAATPDVAADPYIKMGLYLTDRFVERLHSSQLASLQDSNWSILQMEEVDQVLTQTEKRIAGWPQAHALSPNPYRNPIGAPAVIKDGVFYTDTSTGKDQPFFYAGYGHFTQVFNDLPNFPLMGASLIQDGRAGPSGMDEDGRLLSPAHDIIDSVHRAQRVQMKVDYLLSPHYFPDWAAKKWPDAFANTAGWSVQHEKLCLVIKQWIDVLFPYIRDSSGLFSVCLDNEPTSSAAGRDRYTLPLWFKYLQDTHGDIATLNKLYGTNYASFDKVPVPGGAMPAKVEEQRAFYDWCHFNDHAFGDFNKWMSDQVHAQVPKIPTHSKIMVFYSLDRDKMAWGVDPEQFCNVTDIAGCDAYAFPDGGEYGYGWQGNEFFYDLLNSFHNQPVFNSENHVIPDGSGPQHIPPGDTRSALWQGGLHHQGATTIWVWEEQKDPALVGSIYFRPANIYAAGQAMMDLNRFGNEVAAINQQHPRVALLYSRPSLFWQENFKDQMISIYTQLSFLGEPVTFVSEQQLAENRTAKVDVIIVTQATHVTDATVVALAKFVQAGGKVILEGEGNLAFDQYHRPRNLPQELSSAIIFKTSSEEAVSVRTLHELLTNAGLKLTDVNEVGSKSAWGVEYRTVPFGDRTLVPMINLRNQAATVSLANLRGKAVDLLAGEEIDLANISLPPMTPRLLSIAQN